MKTTIYNWFSEFKGGRVNLCDKFRYGQSSTAVNNKNIDAMRRMIRNRQARVLPCDSGNLRHRHESNTINPTQTFGYEKAVLAVDSTYLTEF
ncbi:hypothetical protein EVAR_3665_1 [Eumeta japonica]|uniref:Mos1 transposase HTH domain-containing protein n=1 Tax=Eumeta variegata TaxID=151549 RepID=A0A4C1SRV1_EUMVA|nr:hypothetical protein EVAR_3665_1 [Eumeta japonica]